MCFDTPKIVIALFCLVILAARVSPIRAEHFSPPGLKTSAALETTQGLKTAVFKSDAGTIRVNLPDDLAAGDTISGSVYLTPAGTTEKGRSENQKSLNGYVIEIENQLSPSSVRMFKIELPANIKNNEVGVNLRDGNGRKIAGISVPASETTVALDEGNFQIPEGAQTGNWINMLGAFDGDAANTSLSIGGTPVDCLAESPRKSVFHSPAEIVGRTELVLREGNTEIVQQFRNIDVRLAAAKLSLQRGESTVVTLKVTGLEGIEDDVPLFLSCSGSADMQGGNAQTMQISPSEVSEGGTFTQSRTLVGNQIGNFNVTAAVLFDVAPRVLNNNLVHIENTPRKMGNVWGVRVKTLDGKSKWVFFDKEPPPIVRACSWIEITESRTDEDGDIYVSGFQPADDPNQPCLLENKVVHVEGSPIKLPDGRWQIKIKLPNGNNGYVYVRAPVKPDLRLCKWIKVSACKKLSSNSFEVGGYTETNDPDKPPPAPVESPTPTPTPTPMPEPPPAPFVKPCEEGATRPLRTDKNTFEILSLGSQLSFSVETNAGGGKAAAEGMAAWLSGLAKLGSFLTGQFIPDDQKLGGGVADAALKYVELGGEIIGGLAKSNIGNSRVTRVTGTLSTRLIKVTAICNTYEVCENGDWIKKKSYTEERELVYYSKSKTVDSDDTAWKEVTNPSTSTFDIEKAEKYLMTELLKDLKKNEEAYGKLKESCK